MRVKGAAGGASILSGGSHNPIAACHEGGTIIVYHLGVLAGGVRGFGLDEFKEGWKYGRIGGQPALQPGCGRLRQSAVSYTHLRAHET